MALADLHAQGKVRDIFQAAPDRLLMVATDRISAFDASSGPVEPRSASTEFSCAHPFGANPSRICSCGLSRRIESL